MGKLENARRYRLNVPREDTSVQEWLDAQVNISMSIRALIREDIVKNGCTDITCREVIQRGKVGRPTNAELEQRAQQDLSQAQDMHAAEAPGPRTERRQPEPPEDMDVPLPKQFTRPGTVPASPNPPSVDDVLSSML